MLNVVILTALRVECLAVCAHLNNRTRESHPLGTVYECGQFIANGRVWKVNVAEVGAGSEKSALAAERAIAHFNPDILLFVGIAGGIKDVVIGDVVAATEVYGYEYGKDGEGFATRPAVGNSSFRIVEGAKAEARGDDWLKRLSGDASFVPQVYVAPIAAGAKVLASRNSELFEFIRASYNDAIAVEMEGYGFLSAAFAQLLNNRCYRNVKRGCQESVR